MYQGVWYVLHVIANHEKKVAQHLNARGVEHYLPLYTEQSRWSDRSVKLERPLFTGYVFVRFAYQSRLSVITTPGVIRLLGDSRCETVTPEEIEKIRTGLSSGYVLRPHLDFPLGTRVRVCRGVFEGTEGVVTEFRQHCKVIVSLAAVRQCFSLEIDADDIEVLRERRTHPNLVSAHNYATA